MADTTKPVETAPVAEPVVETKPAEEAPVVAAATETPAPAAETEAAVPAAAETTEAPAAEEAKKDEEVKPVEEGALAHKPEGASFPKNLLHSKKFFWFGSEPIDLKSTASFKADKAVDVAHHVTAWAAETGKGLLFFGEKDKSAPQGAIHLAEASEPVNDGSHKFHFTSKGHKHSFKAASAAERDTWVAQIKVKIAEAKELAATVTESEKYKSVLESLKPAKKEKTPEPTSAPEAAAAETTETPAPAADTSAETPAASAEEAKEDAPAEEPKRRSASRKRASIFGSLLGKKEEKPKAEAAPETKAAEEPAAEASTAAVTETPAVEAPKEEAVAPAEAATETKAEDKKEEVAEAKPAPAKRASLFGNLSFGKKKVASPEPTPATEGAPATTEAVAETAPVIPAVETTEPLSTEVTSPTTAPVETTEVAPATNGETKEVKNEKRKSSLPFIGGFLNKEKATSGDESEKPKSPSPFSKLRATIKGKKEAKAEEAKTEEKPEEPAAEAAATDAPAAVSTEEAPKPAEETAEPAKPVAAPVVTAAA